MRQEILRMFCVRILPVFTLCCLVALVGPHAIVANDDSVPYAVAIAYRPSMPVSRGAEVPLDIQVTNVSARKSDQWIAAIVIDFSSTHLSPLDCGALPLDWQGVLERGGVMTYIAGHGVSALGRGASVRLSPRIRIPTDAVDVVPPRVFVVPLSSMRSFEGPALKALDHVKHREVRPTANLKLPQ